MSQQPTKVNKNQRNTVEKTKERAAICKIVALFNAVIKAIGLFGSNTLNLI